MTRLKTATAAVTSVALLSTLVACRSDDDPGGFRPHPPKSSTPAGPDAAGSTSSGPTPDSPPSGEPRAPEPVAPPPAFLYPNGREVTLTAPGTSLRFGDPATLATTDQEGRYLVWSVIVHDSVVRSPDQVLLVDPAEGAGTDHYLCYAYDITFLGAVPRYTDDPTVLTVIPDTERASTAAPEILPATADGADAHRVAGGTDEGCGIPPDNRLPAVEGALDVDHAYARGVLGPVGVDAAAEGTATGVRYDAGGGKPVTWS